MIFIILGGALLWVVGTEIARDLLGMQGVLLRSHGNWPMSAVAVVVLVGGLRRWPRDWRALAVFTAAMLVDLNRGLAPGLVGVSPALVGAGGLYVAWYGWRTRAVNRGEKEGLLLFAVWFVMVVGLGAALIALGW